MQSLIDQVDLINESLKVGIRNTYKSFGLTNILKKKDKNVNVDVKSGLQVIIDDEYSSFFYHKLNGNITYDKVKSPGKKNLYNAKAPISLVCFSNQIGFDEHVLSRLSNVRLLTINNLDNDSAKIITEETELKGFDFDKRYLFVVNYQILYKTSNCYESCQ
jgi:hypothetical protein